MLVSQGGEPDYLITVWNWRKSAILLRTKSYVNDVFRVLFSPYVPGHLTTCGKSKKVDGNIKETMQVPIWEPGREYPNHVIANDEGK